MGKKFLISKQKNYSTCYISKMNLQLTPTQAIRCSSKNITVVRIYITHKKIFMNPRKVKGIKKYHKKNWKNTISETIKKSAKCIRKIWNFCVRVGRLGWRKWKEVK